ncbi:MAG: hypothetical protein FWF51_10940 [Chitinivibrionia bacterium]|nr:hypothetical protein [Chitinivibrionia bacterium]
MKKIALVFLVLFFLGCSYIDYPDDYIKKIKFTGDIVDIEKMQITSKDELVQFFDTLAVILDTPPIYFYGSYKKYRLEIREENLEYTTSRSDFEYVIYIKPLSSGNPVLNINVYESGMPIAIGNSPNTMIRYSKQPVILIRGKPEWADSSYKGFTILPVANSVDESELDFTWTLKKQKIQS